LSRLKGDCGQDRLPHHYRPRISFVTQAVSPNAT
jgi:hypothetical protein